MKLLIIDSNSLMNRAYYGIKYLSANDGTPTNGIYGFMNILLKLIGEENPDGVVFTFDRKEPTFRHLKFDGYKATRSGMPDELRVQFPLIKEIITAWGYPILEMAGFEADDLIGTVARLNGEALGQSVIITGDRDSFQLTSEQTSIRLATTKVAKGEDLRIDMPYILEKYGVPPQELIDIKGLMGDTSDNIPGVAGVGEKTAITLIGAFHSIDNVYANIEDPMIKKGVRQKLLDDKDNAYLSRELATINCHVPLPVTLEELLPKETNKKEMRELLLKLDLKKLVTRLEQQWGEDEVEEVVAEKEHCPDAVTTTDLSLLLSLEELYLESHFTGRTLNSLTLGGLVEGTITTFATTEVLPLLTSLSTYKGLLHTDNLKELHFYGFTHNVSLPQKRYDLQIAAYILAPLSSDYSIPTLAENYGFEKVDAYLSLMPTIAQKQKVEMEQSGQLDLLYNMEIPLAEVLASMEYHGFKLDTVGLTAYGEGIATELKEIAEEIYRYSGEQFNINSPKQLGVILFEKLGLPTRKKTKSGYSTNAEVLDSLKNKHPIIPLILQYRQLAKLHSTYVLGLLEVVGEDGRIHTVFRQKETRTGRISSTEPNLQNIPVRTERGRALRRFFCAKEGTTLVDADYSQIELRVLASIAEDATMIETFKAGGDIHTQTASQVFDLPPELINSILRSRAKAVNFGIVYGIGAFSLSGDIGVTVAEADQYIKNYLNTYSGVRQYMEDIKTFGAEKGYVTTLYGRRRPIPELRSSNKVVKALGERVAMNTPIQGTAADIIKLAMIKVYRGLKAANMESKLILQVHDELIVEAPVHELEAVKALLEREMETACELLVPMTAEAHQGDNWLDAK